MKHLAEENQLTTQTAQKRFSADYLASLPADKVVQILQSMTPEEQFLMERDWRFWARDNQLPPATDNWFLWMILAGRGFGKSWVGGNWINECAESGKDEHIALVGRDAHDVRSFMVEGSSGIMPMAHSDFYPAYEPSKKLITWPNGCKAHIYYAEEPKTIRGPNHSKAWADEIASWQDAHLGDGEDTAWSNLMMTMRVGSPQVLVTGTPKPLKLVKQLVKRHDSIVVRGNTYDNRANLSPVFFKNVVSRYEGTRLGRQELNGEILDDNPGALIKREMIEGNRLRNAPDSFDRIVVAIDPSVAGVLEEGDDVNLAKTGAEAGIIVCAKRGRDFFVLEDCTPPKGSSPLVWAKTAIMAYEFWFADCIVAERNNGGAMVELTIRTTEINGRKAGENVKVETVWASRGKQTRAEPVSGLYEQGRVHHVGTFEELEDQWCQWEPVSPEGKIMPSPDRLDACVWGLTLLADLDQELSQGSDEDYGDFWEKNDPWDTKDSLATMLLAYSDK